MSDLMMAAGNVLMALWIVSTLDDQWQSLPDWMNAIGVALLGLNVAMPVLMFVRWIQVTAQ